MKGTPKRTAAQKRRRESARRPTAHVDFALRALNDTIRLRDYEREFLEEIGKGHIEAERIARITREFARGFHELHGIVPCVTVFGSAHFRPSSPFKAGRRVKGKLHTGYFWPVYGDQDEVAFPFATSRTGTAVRETLGSFCGVLLTNGYIVYDRFAQTVNRLVHAQCWSHTRRQFVYAERVEPRLVAEVLDFIGALYAPGHGRDQGLS